MTTIRSIAWTATGEAGCKGGKACEAVLGAQKKALSAAQATRAALRAFQKSGTKTAQGKAFASAFEKAFGDGSSQDARQVSNFSKTLDKAMAFMSDPGTVAGGNFDYIVGNTGDRGGTIDGNRVMLTTNFAAKTMAGQINDVVHEPLHLIARDVGLGGDKQIHGYVAYGVGPDLDLAKANFRWTRSAVHNADNYSRLIVGQIK